MLTSDGYWSWRCSSSFLCLFLYALGFALVSPVELPIAPTAFLVAERGIFLN
jgi:hypothetical protein